MPASATIDLSDVLPAKEFAMALAPDLAHPLTRPGKRGIKVLKADDRYPPDSEPPMPEQHEHRTACIYVTGALQDIFPDRAERPLIRANMDIYWQEWKPEEKTAKPRNLSSDVFLAFGVALERGASYRFWELDGQAPDLVMEMASPSTRRQDSGEKLLKYAELGIREYWQYAPMGDLLDSPLQGWRLREGSTRADNRYEPIGGQENLWGIDI